MPKFHYTDKQLKVEKYINEVGFRTELEKVYGQYCVDIWLPELNWVVEIDGPTHWNKERQKRDAMLMKEHNIAYILHYESNISKARFIDNFKAEIAKNFNGQDIEKRT